MTCDSGHPPAIAESISDFNYVRLRETMVGHPSRSSLSPLSVFTIAIPAK
jgi:hypothetical protein